MSLSILGFQRPLAILVGQAEALALVHSAGADLRRPSTLATWRHCLAVRCCRSPSAFTRHRVCQQQCCALCGCCNRYVCYHVMLAASVRSPPGDTALHAAPCWP